MTGMHKNFAIGTPALSRAEWKRKFFAFNARVVAIILAFLFGNFRFETAWGSELLPNGPLDSLYDDFFSSITHSPLSLRIEINPPLAESFPISPDSYKPISPKDPVYAKDGLNRIQAYQFWVSRDYRQAAVQLLKIQRPTDADLRFLVHIFLATENWKMAYEMVRKIKKIGRMEGLTAGILATKLAKYEDARKIFQQMLRLYPRDSKIIEHVGNLHFFRKDLKGAVGQWQTAYKLADPERQRKLALLIGRAALQNKDYSMALKYLLPITNQADSLSLIRLRLVAEAYQRLGYLDRAIQCLDTLAIASEGWDDLENDILKKKLYIYYLLGNRERAQGDRPAALRFYKEADRLIGIYYADRPQFMAMQILRGILYNLLIEVAPAPNYAQAATYWAWLVQELVKRPDAVSSIYLKRLADLLYLSSNPALASNCYSRLLSTDAVAANNYYTLNPQQLDTLGWLAGIKCDKSSAFIFLNVASILNDLGRLQEARQYTRRFQACVRQLPKEFGKQPQIQPLLNNVRNLVSAKNAASPAQRHIVAKTAESRLLPPRLNVGKNENHFVLVQLKHSDSVNNHAAFGFNTELIVLFVQ